MAEKKDDAVETAVTPTHPSSDISSESVGNDKLHLVSRFDGNHEKPTDDNIQGYDEELMRARVLLSNEEEKRLMRKVDWYLLPLMSIIYMLKTIDANNVWTAFFP